jgi:hypothetical protein
MMTEAEWMASDDATEMFSVIRRTLGWRSHILFGVACVHATPGVEELTPLWRATEMMERVADDFKLWTQLDDLRDEISGVCADAPKKSAGYFRALAAGRLLTDTTPPFDNAPISALLHRAALASGANSGGLCRAYARLLRDIAGNPFQGGRGRHLVTRKAYQPEPLFRPEWGTETVAAIARGMYESRDFSPMPILADALQDAGCDNDDILNHCRGDGPHVRGCWVVDLVLGKE